MQFQTIRLTHQHFDQLLGQAMDICNQLKKQDPNFDMVGIAVSHGTIQNLQFPNGLPVHHCVLFVYTSLDLQTALQLTDPPPSDLKPA